MKSMVKFYNKSFKLIIFIFFYLRNLYKAQKIKPKEHLDTLLQTLEYGVD